MYSFDPVLSRNIETYAINEVTVNLPWEDNLKAGPVDDYLEVVDYDPASQAFYAPVDLNDPYLLAQDGLAPSEGTPKFHQQMAYAVARSTICQFENALGRRALWSKRVYRIRKGKSKMSLCPFSASIPTVCGRPMHTTVLIRRLCFSVTFPPPLMYWERIFLEGSCLLVCHTILSPMRRLMRC